MFPRLRQVAGCTGCGLRTMCISDDGGDNWSCNRCNVRFGLNRANLYDNAEKVVTKDSAVGASVQDAEAEFQKQIENRKKYVLEQKQPEVKTKEEKPNDTPKRKAKPTTEKTA